MTYGSVDSFRAVIEASLKKDAKQSHGGATALQEIKKVTPLD